MSDWGEALDVAGDHGPKLGTALRPLFDKLKPGPGLPADLVIADQHRRLQGALVALVDEEGWEEVRVRSLVRAAGVSTTTFYKHFADIDECLVSTFDSIVEGAVKRAVEAGRREGDFHASLVASVGSLMRTWADEPSAARLVLIDIFDAGSGPRKRISSMVGKFEALLAISFERAPEKSSLPRPLIAAMAAGMMHVTRTTLLADRTAELPVLAEQLVDWMSSLPGPEVLQLIEHQETAGAARARREREPFPEPIRCLEGVGDRERLLRAAVKVVTADGLTALTPPRLRAEAEVSRRSFDALYKSVDECFLDSIETVATDAATEAREWSTAAPDWQRQTCRFTLAICAQAARNRPQARLAFLATLATGRAGFLRRERMVIHLASFLRATVPSPRRPSVLTAEASTAASWQLAQSTLTAGRARSLPRLSPLMTYLVLAPIVGSVDAGSLVEKEFD